MHRSLQRREERSKPEKPEKPKKGPENNYISHSKRRKRSILGKVGETEKSMSENIKVDIRDHIHLL